ncbi:fimbrial protein [Pseudomonas alkylphenolica]|uniref:Fimbrial regulatory protein MrfB n=1 Tax=Pseudomonas alkylphenolica TaxID=237609 RepID=A0A077FD99_9PSED|nr:fimbrial protein [Pseudomonas alkylphenolica]AIL61829.1 fimbrial regulatory protein MrfB [Pseudomonas alkylphenolica]
MIRSTALLLMPLFLYAWGQPASAAEAPIGGALKGRVQLAGSIVDSACSIRVGNDNQTVAFKPTALNGLVSGDSSSQQSLSIHISDCISSSASSNSEPAQRFKLAFEGEAEGKYFGIQGGAQGIALQIKDEQGKLISPGMLLEHSSLSSDSLMLNYSLSLVGSGHALEAGDYHATIKLSIQHF